MAKHNSSHAGASVTQHMMHVLTDALVKARAGILPAEQIEKWRATHDAFEQMESELQPFAAGMWKNMLAIESLPDGLRGVLEEMSGPENQVGFLLQIIGFIGGMLAILPQLGGIEVREAVYDFNRENLNVPLTPADAADGVMRGVVSLGDGESAAAAAGVGAGDFGWMVQLIGEPPGLMDMLSLYRRGLMDWGTFHQMVQYSRVNVDYADWFQLLAFDYMSPADVIGLALKGIPGDDSYEAMFAKAGGLAEQFQPLFEAAGDAIGNEAALGLLNQGFIGQSDVEEVFGRSRMNPLFYNMALDLRHKFLAPYQISQILKTGGATPAQATQWMINLGYGADQAAALVASAPNASVAKAKTETEAMVVDLFMDQVITEQAAGELLANMGYDTGSIELILSTALGKQAVSQRGAALTAVKTAFMESHISETEASGDIDALNFPPAARDQWLADWAVEKSTKLKSLTLAQVGNLAKNGIIDYPTAAARWSLMGYADADLPLIGALYDVGPAVPTD